MSAKSKAKCCHILKKKSSYEQDNAHYGPRPAKVAG